jgi:predicted neuraminidase
MKQHAWMMLLTALLALAPHQGLADQSAANSSQTPVVLAEFVFQSAPFPSCHAATIAETNDGLVCAYFGGTAERNPDVCIWVSRKEHGATNWTPPTLVADGIQPTQNVPEANAISSKAAEAKPIETKANEKSPLRYPTWNPVLFQPRKGDLFLFYKVGPKPADWWGMLTRSSDGGKNWMSPQHLGDGLIGPVKNQPIELPDGVILAPSSNEHDGWKVHMERSTDHGNTWQSTGPLNDPKSFQAIQPTLLQYTGGKIQALSRTKQNVIAEIWSQDEGQTWSPMQATALPNNNSGLDAVTLADGRQLLVYNHSTADQPNTGDKGRGILNVALSRDGKNWEAALVLDHTTEPGKQFSYPTVIQTKDGLVHIVYTWNRQRIKHVVLDPKKLTTQPIVDGRWPDSIQ